MYDAIKNFPQQFAFKPKIDGLSAPQIKKFAKYKKFIVAGMGGSRLAAELLKISNPTLPVLIWNTYGLPPLPAEELKKNLLILCSYSGNTEEVLDVFKAAKKKKLSLAVVAANGELLNLAKKIKIPYVQIPMTGLQPRMATGFMLKALLKIMGEEKSLEQLGKLVKTLDSLKGEDQGRELAETLKNKIPLIYASFANRALAENWKIKFNETGKIPAFYNVFPELNHNGMNGFDARPLTKGLSANFQVIILKDSSDHPRIQKRMEILAKLYQSNGIPVKIITLVKTSNIFYKIFSCLILADFTAYYLAKYYQVEPNEVPMVEEFKKLIG
jgi:glucose/mannose-6-phosphate isomerase